MHKLLIDAFDIWSSAQAQLESGRGRSPGGSNAFYGVKRVKELLLNLAFSGLLVHQEDAEADSAKLKELIHSCRDAGLRVKKSSKKVDSSEVADGEKYFDIPSSWTWVRLGETGVIFSGNSINENEKLEKYSILTEGLPFIATKDVGYGGDTLNYQNGVLIPLNEDRFKVAHAGSVLICSEGGSAGRKIGITERDICFGNKLIANEPWACISPKYIFYLYQSGRFFNEFSEKMTGIIGGISLNQFLSIPVPIPPYQEQVRIVSKLDQLMALCDHLNELNAASLDSHKLFVKESLGILGRSRNAKEFKDGWAFIQKHFDILFDSEESIEYLKIELLELALMGKLVPQIDEDESAKNLLSEIAHEKECLISAGLIKNEKPLAEIADEEKSFLLPRGWEWARLQAVIDVRDGTHDSPKESSDLNSIPLVTSKDFADGDINFSEAKRISLADHEEISKRSFVEKYDILFSMIGGNIGNQVMVKTDQPFSIKNVALFKYYSKDLTYPFFIKKYTEHLAERLQDSAVGGAQPFVSLGQLRSLVIAIPPKNEQRRIVEKLDGLLSICDNLKEKLNESNKLRQKIANTLVDDVFI